MSLIRCNLKYKCCKCIFNFPDLKFMLKCLCECLASTVKVESDWVYLDKDIKSFNFEQQIFHVASVSLSFPEKVNHNSAST